MYCDQVTDQWLCKWHETQKSDIQGFLMKEIVLDHFRKKTAAHWKISSERESEGTKNVHVNGNWMSQCNDSFCAGGDTVRV